MNICEYLRAEGMFGGESKLEYLLVLEQCILLTDRMVVWCLSPFLTVFQLYCGSQCTSLVNGERKN